MYTILFTSDKLNKLEENVANGNNNPSYMMKKNGQINFNDCFEYYIDIKVKIKISSDIQFIRNNDNFYLNVDLYNFSYNFEIQHKYEKRFKNNYNNYLENVYSIGDSNNRIFFDDKHITFESGDSTFTIPFNDYTRNELYKVNDIVKRHANICQKLKL
jgi:hypothetical protein